MKKSNPDLVRSWLEKARRDLKMAVSALNDPEPLTDMACFHAQQAAEKYVKAYLSWCGMEFPRTHAVEDLIVLAGRENPAVLGLKDEGATLTPYAVETRYPEFEEPLREDAEEAVKTAEKIRDLILSLLPLTGAGGR